MRTLFWVLLLGNVMLFAAVRWGGLLAGDEPAIQAQPALNEEKIRLVDTGQRASAAVSAATRPEASACMEWGDFSGADLVRATAGLAALSLGEKLGQRQFEQNIGYWVYMPPLKDRAAVVQKIAQLKVRGVEEYFVVTDEGQWQNAISLGIFKTREAAQGFLEELRTKGVRSAQVGERTSKLKMTVFVFSQVDAATVDKLTAMQKSFPSSVLRNISCAR